MTDWPEIGRPLARGAAACHVLAVRDNVGTMVAACGTACGRFCGEHAFDGTTTICPEHDELICQDCIEIVVQEKATGEWHGVESDPHHGRRQTVCIANGCPETVLVGSCWCDEHLRVCDVAGCSHPAHDCSAAVHFCEAHGGPEL